MVRLDVRGLHNGGAILVIHVGSAFKTWRVHIGRHGHYRITQPLMSEIPEVPFEGVEMKVNIYVTSIHDCSEYLNIAPSRPLF
jgi:hypothetical protein